MADQLKGLHALITGAGGGIGLAVTAAYLREGARCTAADIREAPSSELHALMQAHPDRLHYVAADVASNASIAAMVAGARQRFGTVTVLFNNAAVFDLAPLLEADERSYQRIFDVNEIGRAHV